MALSKKFRLSREKDIKKTLQSFRAAENDLFRLFLHRNSLPRGRLVFLLSKKVSKSAVRRNLLKRRASEWARKFFLDRLPGYDIVLVFKEKTASLNRSSFYKELEFIFSRIRV